jgi:sialic acid synthase SpsE
MFKIIDKNTRPFILGEVACSHDGSIDRVIKIINSVADGGMDGIQFQLFSTDLLLAPYHPFYKKVKQLEIKLNDWPLLIELAQNRGLKVFANVLETSGMDIAISSNVDAIKVHSADISNPEMLKSVTDSHLPIILSTGGSTVEEIRVAVEELKLLGADNLLLMHGFQAYPTDITESHLEFIGTLGSMFGVPVGYQDHIAAESEMSRIVPLLAMAKGAVLLEKHVTDDRGRKGTDHESALSPTEISDFVKRIEQGWRSFGDSTIRPLSDKENQYRRNFKKTIVSTREIMVGEKITKDMICFLRADQGYSPTSFKEIIGKRCIKSMNKFDTFKSYHLNFD